MAPIGAAIPIRQHHLLWHHHELLLAALTQNWVASSQKFEQQNQLLMMHISDKRYQLPCQLKRWKVKFSCGSWLRGLEAPKDGKGLTCSGGS